MYIAIQLKLIRIVRLCKLTWIPFQFGATMVADELISALQMNTLPPDLITSLLGVL